MKASFNQNPSQLPLDVAFRVAREDSAAIAVGLERIDAISIPICPKRQHFNPIDASTADNICETLWEGERTEGPTQIRSGPDYNKWNCTIHVKALDSTEGLTALFVGCFLSKEISILQKKRIEDTLKLAGREEPEDYLRKKFTDIQSEFNLRNVGRSYEQLRQGMKPCGLCDTINAKKKCSGCKSQFYCSKDHQRQAWKTHKKECKAAAKMRTDSKASIKKEKKKVPLQDQKQAKRDLSTSSTKGVLEQEKLLYTTIINKHPQIVLEVKQIMEKAREKERDIKVFYYKHFKIFTHLMTPEMQRNQMWWAVGVKQGFLDFLVTLMHAESQDNIKKNITKSGSCSEMLLDPNILIQQIDGIRCLQERRCYQFYVETEKAWETTILCASRLVRLCIDPKLHTELRQAIHDKTNKITITLCDLLTNKIIGPEIVKQHMSEIVLNELKTMIDLLETDDANSGGKELDFGHAVTTNINQLASLIEAWCEVLELRPNFRQSLHLSVARNMRYEKLLLAPSRIAIQLGRMPNGIEWVMDTSNDKLYNLLTAWEGLDSYGKLNNQSAKAIQQTRNILQAQIQAEKRGKGKELNAVLDQMILDAIDKKKRGKKKKKGKKNGKR